MVKDLKVLFVSAMFKIICVIAALLFCTACATPVVFDGDRPKSFLQRKDVINLPYKISDAGLIVVPVYFDENGAIDMILDTGATQSAIYSHLQNRLNLSVTDKTVQIHGMIESGLRPELSLPFLKLDQYRIDNLRVAMLETSSEEQNDVSQIGGLIGLDVLSEFHIYFDKDTKILSLIPTRYANLELPNNWLRVKLKSNPFINDNQPLKYLDIRVAGQLIPALFDSGSEFNIMNWSAARHPQLKAIRRKLRKNWELEGAIGQFKPTQKVRFLGLRSGQKFWDSRDFLVLDLDSLDILGVDNQPFAIAGADMMTQNTFWLDLSRNELILKPGKRKTLIPDIQPIDRINLRHRP